MSEDATGAGAVGPLKARVEEFRLAVMFLTRLPVGRLAHPPPLPDSVWAFPIVGALHGAIVGGVYWGLHSLGLSALVSALLAIVAGIVASGALHEDGLADCADGFGGGWTRERKLEIMRDSRIGTYGALALILVLTLRVAIISETETVADAIGALVGLGALTRGLLPPMMLLLPAAREDGMTAETTGRLSVAVVAVAVALGLATAVLLVPHVAAAIAATLLAFAAVSWLAMRQIKGISGDVLGAAQVTGELGGLLASLGL